MTDHTVIRCSELPRVLACPGSLQLNRIVDERDGGGGWEGTAGHWHIADRLISEDGAIGPEGHCNGPDVPRDYVYPLKELEWVINWACERVRHFVPQDWTLLVEKGMAYNYGRFTLSGHMDVASISPDGRRMWFIDWKLGRAPQPLAELNEQVAGYFLNAKTAWPNLREITGCIGQPFNVPEEGFDRLSTVTLAGEDLEEFPAGMVERINDARSRSNEVETGITQCRYCSAFGPGCPAITALIEFVKAQLTPAIIAEIHASPTNGRLGQLVYDLYTISKPMEEMVELLHARLDNEPVIVADGGKRITRDIRNGAWKTERPLEVLKAVLELLPQERAAKCLTLGKGAFETEYAEHAQIPKHSEKQTSSSGVFQALLAPHMVQGKQRLLRFN